MPRSRPLLAHAGFHVLGEPMIYDPVDHVEKGRYFGSQRWAITASNYWEFGAVRRFWVEGIGMYRLAYWAETLPGFDDQLIYARSNGVEYGTPLAVNDAPPAPRRTTLLGIYPNPASVSSQHVTIRYRTSGGSLPMRITLHDALGREARAFTADGKEGGIRELLFDIAGLGPGMYFCRFHADDVSSALPFLLLR